jgi:hypothetical protein
MKPIHRRAATALSCAIVAICAQAQASESFRNSCTGTSTKQINGQIVIHSFCKSYTGVVFGTSLTLPPGGCVDIENRNASLRCILVARPGGSWAQSCYNGRYTSGMLFAANCKDRSGNTASTVFDMRLCASRRLDNINGSLKCN